MASQKQRARESMYSAILRRQEYVEKNYDKMVEDLGEDEAGKLADIALHNYIVTKEPHWRESKLRHPIS